MFSTADGYQAAAVPFLDQRLHLFSSGSPVGPWTLDKIVALDSIAPDTRAFAYEPLMVDMTGDDAVFAVNFLPVDPNEVLSDVALYGPRFLRVDLGSSG